MNKKINIGLDIGVASVGWSIIDENEDIIDLGVRLFDDVANNKDGKLENANRRTKRGQRRRINRIRTRKNEFKKFVLKNNLLNSEDEFNNVIRINIKKFNLNNPIELRVKALKEKINNDALIFLLFNYLHHRGSFHITEEDIKENQNLLDDGLIKKNIFPSEKIYNFYVKNGYYKNSNITRNIKSSEYESEIRKILDTQGFNNELINSYINIFKSKRDFSIGPGGKKSPTPYGLYERNSDGTISKLKINGVEVKNLWDKTIGRCTYYENEYRGLKNSPIAEVFNLLNDLSNIHFFRKSDDDYKLNEVIKKIIFKKYSDSFFGKEFNLNKKELIKIINSEKYFGDNEIKPENINGYRIESEGGKEENYKELITKLKNYRLIFKWLIDTNQINITKDNFNFLDIKFLTNVNNIFEELAKEQDLSKRLEILNTKNNSNIEVNKELIKKLKNLSSTHSLSYKAMNEYINHFCNNLNTNDNQMVYFNNVFKNLKDENKCNSKKYIENKIGNEVISPTTKRSFNQTINVLNKILKKYGKKYDIDNITIEMPRDKNSYEEKKSIDNSQKKNKEIIDNISKEYGIDKDDLKSSQKRLRFKLWMEQDKRDIYDNQEINLDEVNSGYGLQIDHIIPYSISYDDSFNNKVLTKSTNNKEKNNRTPYQWLSNLGKFEQFKDRISSNVNLSSKKKLNLLDTSDQYSNLGNFIGRNLSDTRYASRLILNTLQDFFYKNKNYGEHTKVKVIRGSMTSFARNNLFIKDGKYKLLPKDRNIYCHHAIDASIVCYLGMNHKIQLLLDFGNLTYFKNNSDYDIIKSENIDEQSKIINKKTGEIVDINNALKINDSIINFGEQLSEYNTKLDYENNKLISGKNSDKVKYSRMLLTKNNIQLSDETIYSFKYEKDKEGNNLPFGRIVASIKLLEAENKKLNKYFLDYNSVEGIEKKRMYWWKKMHKFILFQ